MLKWRQLFEIGYKSVWWKGIFATLIYSLLPLGAAFSEESNYVIGPNDVVDVRVFQEDDLTASAKVNADGSISLPLIGSVKIAGKSVDQAGAAIRSAYMDGFLVNPQVTVVVGQYYEKSFTVLGQVKSPGTYTFSGAQSMTLLEAIGKAGGYTRIADAGRIDIKRRAGEKETVIRVNGKKNAREDAKSIPILPGDVVIVAESLF